MIDKIFPFAHEVSFSSLNCASASHREIYRLNPSQQRHMPDEYINTFFGRTTPPTQEQRNTAERSTWIQNAQM